MKPLKHQLYIAPSQRLYNITLATMDNPDTGPLDELIWGTLHQRTWEAHWRPTWVWIEGWGFWV